MFSGYLLQEKYDLLEFNFSLSSLFITVKNVFSYVTLVTMRYKSSGVSTCATTDEVSSRQTLAMC